MPVRKIPISRRVITGHQSLKRHRCLVAFESLLERDFLLLTDFDWNVASVEGQPVKIHWKDEHGRTHPYTPDFLVKFKSQDAQVPGAQPGKARPWLVEVKDEKTLRKDWKLFRRRFQAATRYSLERGWTFRLFTERIIRTPFLANVKNLLPLLDVAREPAIRSALLCALARQSRSTPAELVDSFASTRDERSVLLRAVWLLIADGLIGASLDQPLSLQTPIWQFVGSSHPLSLQR